MDLPFSIAIDQLIRITENAADEILTIYNSDYSVEFKDDNSPLTAADKRSHTVIWESLSKLYPEIPILSEEGKDISYQKRKNWDYFWLVDPLDGTKEFIKRNGEFTVNIALIHNQRAILGVIYVPVQKICYYALQGKGAHKVENNNTIKLSIQKQSEYLTVVGSRSHVTPEHQDFIKELEQKHEKIDYISAGSSLKFCLVAEGKADLYPRFGPTMEWDTAAGQAIAEEAGCVVHHATSKQPLLYNKENLLNPFFIVSRL